MKKICIILTLIILTTFAFAVDNSGANAPEVYQGLYPIKYDGGGNVVFTNASDPEWYNYTEGKWANAVTLDKLGQMDPSTATIDNITGYYVWIPRYAYLIRTGYGISDTGRIDIRFLSGTTNSDADGKTYYTVADLDNTHEKWEEVNTVTYIGDRQMDYLVHPAFKFEEELRGIWVGKYEASKGIEREIEHVNTIPSAILWQSIDIASSFEETRNMTTTSRNYDKYNLYGLGEGINTHLVKSTEYGAVVYLDNSIYGDNTLTACYRVNGIDTGKEYVLGYLEGTTGLGRLDSWENKYKDIYIKDENGYVVDKKGTGYLETSDGTTGWNGDGITDINETNGVIVKENAYGMIASDGRATDVGFRVVLTKSEKSRCKIKEAFKNLYSYWWLMENGEVWVMGNNQDGQLGVGHNSYVYIPQKLETDSEGNKVKPIKQILSKKFTFSSRYSYNTFYIAEDGTIYVCGLNRSGSLGVGNSSSPNKITRVKALENVKISEVHTEEERTRYLTEDGEVYVCGTGTYYGLGTGGYSDVYTPTKVTALNNIKIKEIISDSSSMFLLSENGDAYAVGSNYKGSLGVGSSETYAMTVTLVPNLSGIAIKKIVPNSAATYFLTEGGQVYVTGDNQYGQLGLGHNDDINAATLNSRLNGITDIIKGSDEVYFLTENGEVYVCGRNRYGELGMGHKNTVNTATKIPELDGLKIVNVVTNSYNCSGSTFFLADTGEVYSCGYNYHGNLGLGHTSDKNKATKIDSLVGKKINKVIISNVNYCTYFLVENGDVYVCGVNNYGQLGIEGNSKVTKPVKSEFLTFNGLQWIKDDVYFFEKEVYFFPSENAPDSYMNIAKIGKVKDACVVEAKTGGGSSSYSGYFSSYCITENGEVYASGYNEYYQLGIGTSENVKLGGKIVSLEGKKIEKIISDGYDTYYIDNKGAVYANGRNYYGKSGTGISGRVYTATEITSLDGIKIKDIITNLDSTYYISEKNEVYVSGYNSYGQLGIGNNSSVTSAKKITALDGKKIKKLIACGNSAYYITENGELYVSGRSNYGQLGTGDKNNVLTATKLPALDGIKIKNLVSVSVGTGSSPYVSTYILTESGEVYVCGYNNYGQLGTGDTTEVLTATKIDELDGIKIIDVQASTYNSYYLTEDGEVYGSGYNYYGQLGTGDATNSHIPIKIAGLDGIEIERIIAKGSCLWCIDKDGQVYVTGKNDYGQLGANTSSKQKSIIKVTLPEGKKVSEIITDAYNTFWIMEDGEVYGSGYNTYGQLGTGIVGNVKTLSKVKTPENLKITKIRASYGCVFFITEDGEVYSSGDNYWGQLSQGHEFAIATPTCVKITYEAYKDIGNINSIYGNSTSTILEQDNGDIYVIGKNTSGKLGITGKSNIEIATKINLTGIKDVGIGSNFSVFLKDDGSIVGYGNSSINCNGLTGISQIAVGDNHAVFLTKAGEIINKGSTTSAHVAGVDNIYKIVAGANHTVVLKKDGTTKSFGQADSGLTNVVDVFAGKNMTVFLTRDGKVHIMEGNARTELAISNVVYAELNGEQPYFVTYDRDLIDRDGNIIEALGTKMNWVKEVKGNVVLNERMRVYDLSKL